MKFDTYQHLILFFQLKKKIKKSELDPLDSSVFSRSVNKYLNIKLWQTRKASDTSNKKYNKNSTEFIITLKILLLIDIIMRLFDQYILIYLP